MNKPSFAKRFGSRATKLTLGFAVVAARSTKRIAQDVASGAVEAAAEYNRTHPEPTESATRKRSKTK